MAAGSLPSTRPVLALTRGDRALASATAALALTRGGRAHSVRFSFTGAGGALAAVLFARPPEISTRSNDNAQSIVQPGKLSRRERQLQDLVSKFLARGGAHSVRFSYSARGNFQAVLLLQPPRHDEKLHNAPATTATVAPAKAASHGKPPVAEAPTSRPASPAVSANVSKTKVDKNALSARSGGAKRAASSSPTDEDAPPTLTKRAAKKPDYDAWQRHCLLLALEYGIDGPQVMDEALSGDGDEELREAHRDAYRLGDHAMDSDDDVYSDEDDPGDINTGWG